MRILVFDGWRPRLVPIREATEQAASQIADGVVSSLLRAAGIVAQSDIDARNDRLREVAKRTAQADRFKVVS